MKRTVSMLLVSLLAAGTVISCGNEAGQTPANTAPSDTAAASGTEIVTEAPEVLPPVEQEDFGGADFNILTWDLGMYQKYFFSDAETGDLMNDAIFRRNSKAEEYLNIHFVHLTASLAEMEPTVKKSVMASDNAYQMVLTHCINGLSGMVRGNCLYDWNDIETVDLSQPYWNQNCNESLSVNGKLFYAMSDYMIADPMCIFFNKELLASYDLEDPYELVRSNKWTLDKMFDMGKVVTKDLDGDSTFTVNDQYALAGMGDFQLNSFIYSSGLRMVKSDADGMKLTLNSEDMVNLVSKIYDYCNSNNVYLYGISDPAELVLGIESGRALFSFSGVKDMNSKLRETEVDYGVVPYPKLHETQKAYETIDWSGLMCIPSTAADIDLSGKTAEVLAFYSQQLTVPAYYDFLLGDKLSRDTDTREMLELIFDNIVYDPGYNFFGADSGCYDLFYSIPFMVYKNHTGDFSSWYAKYEKSAQNSINKFIAAVNENNG